MISFKFNYTVAIQYIFIIFLLVFSIFSYGKKNSLMNQTCVLNGKVCLVIKNDEEILVVRGEEYPSVSYYDEVEIKEINNNKIQIVNSYSAKSPVVIYSDIVLKDGVLKLSLIRTVSYPNLSPKGGKQECEVRFNGAFNKPLQFYVDKFLFGLSEIEKLKVCKVYKNNK